MRKLFIGLVVALAILPATAQQQPPNRLDVVKRLHATKVFDLTTHDGQGAFTDAVVAALHAEDERWGHLKKKPGQTALHGHAEDAALFLVDGLSSAVDFIGGAGGSNPQPAWQVDAPRYTVADWADPFSHFSAPPPTCPVCPPTKPIPPYAGDEAFDAVGVVLFDDYAAAGQAPNFGMGRWFGRTIYDWIAGNTKTLQESIEKHRKEWRAALGLP